MAARRKAARVVALRSVPGHRVEAAVDALAEAKADLEQGRIGGVVVFGETADRSAYKLYRGGSSDRFHTVGLLVQAIKELLG